MRIGINVPDEVLNRVKEIEPRVNISQVCREALEERVNELEKARTQATSDDIEEHVDRILKFGQGPNVEPDWKSLAFDDARRWMDTVSPEAWEQYIYQSNFLRRKDRDEADMVDIWSHLKEGGGLQHRLGENQEWFVQEYELQFATGEEVDLHAKARRIYSRAWLDYVNVVRGKVEQHYKDEYQRIMKERQARRESDHDPEIPPQLI